MVGNVEPEVELEVFFSNLSCCPTPQQRFSFRKKKDTLEVPASVEVESIVSTQTNSKGSKNKKKPLYVAVWY